jgi:hypothetical protein
MQEVLAMRWMLLFYADEDEWLALPEDERTAAIGQIGAWFAQHAQAGRIVDGHRLAGKREATTVRHGPAGGSGRRKKKPLVMDGPFAETKEALGSYAIVDVPDHAAALAIAESWPGGGNVEVRPVLEQG